MPLFSDDATARTFAETILAEMATLGAGFMTADYEGGNDEGGVQALRLYRDETEPGIFDESGVDLIDVTVGFDHPLWEAAENFLGTEYGSWAGEFHAEGAVYASVKQHRVWTQGSEQVWVDDPRTLEVDLSAEAES